MTPFKTDYRKSNVLLFLGVLFLSLTYFTLTANSQVTRIVWTVYLIVSGLFFIALAIVPRNKVFIEKETLIFKSRFNLFTKTINRNDIKKVKVVDQEYPIGLYNRTLLHLFLWNKKFNRFKQIHLFDKYGKKLFTIDGQVIDNKDFSELVRILKKK